MTIVERNKIQGPSLRDQGVREYQRLENAIEDETGVKCSVLVKPDCISIKTLDWTDYYLAKSVISKRSVLPVVRYGAETKPELQTQPQKRAIKRRAIRV